MRRRAFSLIELLTTISIIAIMVGLLLPALKGVRDAAVKTACLSNLRQVGMGVQMYTHQWADAFPAARYMPEPFVSGDDDPSLPAQLEPHLVEQGNKVWQCPGDDQQVFNLSGSSYMYQAELSGQKLSEFFPVVMFNVAPSQIVVSRDFDGGVFDTTDGEVTVGPFHALRNLLFADFHAGNF